MKIPADAVLTGHLLVIEYMESDGTFSYMSECFGTGKENLSVGKTLELIEYARAQVLAEVLAEAVAEYFDDDSEEVFLADDEDEDEYEYEDDGE